MAHVAIIELESLIPYTLKKRPPWSCQAPPIMVLYEALHLDGMLCRSAPFAWIRGRVVVLFGRVGIFSVELEKLLPRGPNLCQEALCPSLIAAVD